MLGYYGQWFTALCGCLSQSTLTLFGFDSIGCTTALRADALAGCATQQPTNITYFSEVIDSPLYSRNSGLLNFKSLKFCKKSNTWHGIGGEVEISAQKVFWHNWDIFPVCSISVWMDVDLVSVQTFVRKNSLIANVLFSCVCERGKKILRVQDQLEAWESF